jgi:nucleotide-binding universal stress UspA family protein
MYEEIVVPLDLGEESMRVARPVSWLQQRTGARVVVVSAVEGSRTVRDAEAQLSTMVPPALLPACTFVVEHDRHPASLVLETANCVERSIICMATRARPRAAEVLFGSVAAGVVQGAERPLLLVGPHCDDAEHEWASIVACTDGSTASGATMEVATEWAATFGMSLWFVNVHVPVTLAAELTGGGGLSRTERTRDLTDDDLDRLARAHARAGVDPKWEALYGHDAAPILVRYAAARPGSLLALGARGRRGLARRALGNVVQRVVHESRTPVLVVAHRPDER